MASIYFIRALKTGLVKIGISDSFDARLSKLRRENADESQRTPTRLQSWSGLCSRNYQA